MVWVGRSLKILKDPPVPCAGTPSLGVSKPCPTWCWTLLGTGCSSKFSIFSGREADTQAGTQKHTHSQRATEHIRCDMGRKNCKFMVSHLCLSTTGAGQHRMDMNDPKRDSVLSVQQRSAHTPFYGQRNPYQVIWDKLGSYYCQNKSHFRVFSYCTRLEIDLR